ncbi:MAG: hypothetical protein GXY33_07580 [Phycisphaerae bacterium]|nr:hypothetical protein [Phycisphaerae bacterium]
MTMRGTTTVLVCLFALVFAGDILAANVRDFGAIGDGQANDTEAFRKAMASGEKDIFVPPGTYLLGSETLDVPEGVFLHGLGRNSTIKLAEETAKIFDLGPRVRLSRLHFDCAGSPQGGSNDGIIRLGGESHFVAIEDVSFADCKRVCIVTDHANDLVIRSCDFRNVGWAVSLTFSKRAKVLDNTVVKASGHGLQFWGNWKWEMAGCEDLIFANNYLKDAGGGPIWGTGAYRVVMVGNIVDGASDVGLDLEWCFDSTIAGNTVRNCQNAGISLFYSCRNVAVSGNTVIITEGKSGMRGGIWLTGVNQTEFPGDTGHQNVAITGNVVVGEGKPKHGISIGSGTNVVCAANVLQNADLFDRTGKVKVMGEGSVASAAPETLADRMTVVPLSQEWRFQIDPNDIGVEAKWFAVEHETAGWATIRSDMDKDVGWEGQGFGGEDGKGYTGYAWYRAELPQLPEKTRTFAYLVFDMVDEEAWVYLNSVQIGEHSVQSEGRDIMAIWSEPFAVDLSGKLKTDDRNLLAVRVNNTALNGGIRRPAYLVMSDRPAALGELLQAIQVLGPKKDAR